MDPSVEARLIADHPELASERSPVEIKFWNFLPPSELGEYLGALQQGQHQGASDLAYLRDRRKEAANAG